MVVGPSGHVHDPQKSLFLTVDTPNYSTCLKTNPTKLPKILAGANSKSQQSEMLEKPCSDDFENFKF